MNIRPFAALLLALSIARSSHAADAGAIGQPSAAPEVTALISELKSDSASNRVHAAKALVAIGPSAAEALTRAIGPYPSEKASAMIDVLVTLGSEAVPMMLALIRTEKSFELRHNPGLHGILRMGTNALPGLKQALGSSDWTTRGNVIDSMRLLQSMAGLEKGCAQILIQAAKTDPDEKLRVYATDALGYSGLERRQSTPSEAQDGLHELLKDKSQKVRITAAYSLAKAFRESSPEVLAGLIEGLKQGQSDAELAWECVFAMNFLETNAAPALPELTKALQRGDERIASEAAEVIAKLGDPGFAPLSTAAADTNPTVRVSGLNALADLAINFTNQLEASIEILARGLKLSDSDTKQAALNSLRRIGVEGANPAVAKRIIRILSPSKSDSDQWVRSSATNALEELRKVR